MRSARAAQPPWHGRRAPCTEVLACWFKFGKPHSKGLLDKQAGHRRCDGYARPARRSCLGSLGGGRLAPQPPRRRRSGGRDRLRGVRLGCGSRGGRDRLCGVRSHLRTPRACSSSSALLTARARPKSGQHPCPPGPAHRPLLSRPVAPGNPSTPSPSGVASPAGASGSAAGTIASAKSAWTVAVVGAVAAVAAVVCSCFVVPVAVVTARENLGKVNGRRSRDGRLKPARRSRRSRQRGSRGGGLGFKVSTKLLEVVVLGPLLQLGRRRGSRAQAGGCPLLLQAVLHEPRGARCRS